MSFLNALASEGLSVGLRFYNAKVNSRSEALGTPAQVVSSALRQEEHQSARPVEAATNDRALTNEKSLGVSQAAGESRAQSSAAAESRRAPELSPEQMAAGRADAKARLAEDGSLGLLQTVSQSETQSPELQSSSGLSEAEKREVAELKAKEAQIKAEVNAAVQQGVAGAENVEYSYSTGPDGQRYISGLAAGDGEAAAQAAAEEQDSSSAAPQRELSEEEQRQVEQMRDRDREVRIHEQAHVAAAAGLAGAPVYEYETGPDGRRYAVAGHVDLRSGGHSDPEKALQEAETVKRAALAPSSPSSTDRAVAAEASQEASQLRAELLRGKDDEGEEEADGEKNASADSAKMASYGRLGSESAGPAATVFNGSSFGRQVIGAYAAAKFGSLAQSSLRASMVI